MRRLGWGFVDQVLSSATTACWMFGTAHAATVHEFGVFALCTLVFTVLIATCRGLFGTPVALLAGHADLAEEGSRAAAATVATGVAIAPPLALLALAGGAGTWIFPLAVALPLVLVEDVSRFVATAQERPGVACLADALWLAAAATGLGLSWTGTVDNLLLLLSLWCSGALVACLVILGACGLRPRFKGGLRWWRTKRAWRIALGLESLIGTSTTAVVQYVAALLVGVSASAALRGAGSLFGPVSIFLQSIPLAVVPEMRLRGLSAGRDLWLFMSRLARPVSACAVLLGVIGLLVPHQVGELVLGDSWRVTRPLLPATGVEFALVAWLNAANGALRAQARADQLVRNRILFAGASLVLGCGAAIAFRSALAVAIALAVAAGIAALRARVVLLHPARGLRLPT
jgi:hypothetical protein